MKAMRLQVFYRRKRALAGLSTTFRLVLAMPVSWAIRLYPEIRDIFQSLPRAIEERLLRLSTPCELFDVLPYTSDTRRKK